MNTLSTIKITVMIQAFRDVEAGTFPGPEQATRMDEDVLADARGIE